MRKKSNDYIDIVRAMSATEKLNLTFELSQFLLDIKLKLLEYEKKGVDVDQFISQLQHEIDISE